MGRRPPEEVLDHLRLMIVEPGFISFVKDSEAAGVGINREGDDDLSEEEWAVASEARLSELVRSYREANPIVEPPRVAAEDWTDDEWLKVLASVPPDASVEVGEMLVAKMRAEEPDGET